MSIKKITNGIRCVSTNKSYLLDIDDRWSMRVEEVGDVIGRATNPIGEIRFASVTFGCDYKLLDESARGEALDRVGRDLVMAVYGPFINDINRAIEDISAGDRKSALARLTNLRKEILD